MAATNGNGNALPACLQSNETLTTHPFHCNRRAGVEENQPAVCWEERERLVRASIDSRASEKVSKVDRSRGVICDLGLID